MISTFVVFLLSRSQTLIKRKLATYAKYAIIVEEKEDEGGDIEWRVVALLIIAIKMTLEHERTRMGGTILPKNVNERKLTINNILAPFLIKLVLFCRVAYLYVPRGYRYLFGLVRAFKKISICRFLRGHFR